MAGGDVGLCQMSLIRFAQLFIRWRWFYCRIDTDPSRMVEFSDMRILVTGGLGAVGSFLAPELERRGHEVFVVDLRHHHNAPNYARCDVSEFRQVERLWAGGGWPHGYTPKPRSFEMVYHLAAEFGRWNG